MFLGSFGGNKLNNENELGFRTIKSRASLSPSVNVTYITQKLLEMSLLNFFVLWTIIGLIDFNFIFCLFSCSAPYEVVGSCYWCNLTRDIYRSWITAYLLLFGHLYLCFTWQPEFHAGCRISARFFPSSYLHVSWIYLFVIATKRCLKSYFTL